MKKKNKHALIFTVIIVFGVILSISYKTEHKIITKNYNDEQVPASIHYTEYINDKWYGGILELQGDARYVAYDIWQATYEGELHKQ